MRLLLTPVFFALLVLSCAADDAAVDALLEQLASEDPALRDAAELKLADLGSPAEARLRQRQGAAEPEVRARISRVLAAIELGKIQYIELVPLRTINVNHGSISAIAWSPDGKRLFSSGGSGDIRTWEAATGKQIGRFRTEERPFEERVTALAFGKDPNRLWISCGTVLCWDLAEEKALSSFGEGWNNEFKVSPDGTLAWAAGYGYPSVQPFYSFTEKPPPVVKVEECEGYYYTAAWSPDSEYVAISGPGSLAAVRRDGTVTHLAGVDEDSDRACWSPDGRRLFWSHGDSVSIFDRDNFMDPVTRQADFSFIVILDELRGLAVRERNGDRKQHELLLVHIPTLLVARTWELPEEAYVFVSPDREKLAIRCSEGAKVVRMVKGPGK